MRLIDADKLEEYIKNWDIGNGIGHGQSTIIDAINAQSTAYALDKVVEQLKELHELDACDFDNCPVDGIPCYDCTQRRMIERALEIVRGGGIDGN